jgi:hypothetical protein
MNATTQECLKAMTFVFVVAPAAYFAVIVVGSAILRKLRKRKTPND